MCNREEWDAVADNVKSTPGTLPYQIGTRSYIGTGIDTTHFINFVYSPDVLRMNLILLLIFSPKTDNGRRCFVVVFVEVVLAHTIEMHRRNHFRFGFVGECLSYGTQ